MAKTDPVEQNIIGVNSLISSKLNKTPGSSNIQDEGVTGEHRDEFSIDLSDEELIRLSKKISDEYSTYESKIKPRQDANKTYYLGRQKQGSSEVTIEGQPVVANMLFEAEETFLPAALSKNPEPVVYTDNTPEGNEIARSVKTMLQYHSDVLVLRRKLALMTRHWSIYFIGILKHGWDDKIKDITTDVRQPKNFIFDVTGYIDPYGDFVGQLIGERIPTTASQLIELFPKHKAYIIAKVDGKLGTNVTYTEWWSDEYCFYTFENIVLDKNKNPHFNYDTEEDGLDDAGNPIKVNVPGKNHFARPKKPYTFLSVFTLGEQPHDVTGLIEQNIPNQNRITRRTEQIDYNLSKANNSDVFSADNFNQETAKQASKALAMGNPVLVPSGKPISEAIARLQSPGISSDFFAELENSKNDLRSVFGVQGITAQQADEDQTARGMILNQQYDNSRIGGGIGDAIEQVADNVFNWWVQLYYVYYDEEHSARVMGRMKAVEYVTLQNSNLDRRIVVSVSPDSMKPKDEVNEMNQALALWDKGALDPKTLLTILNFPDPQQTAENVVLWKTDPVLYMRLNFPELLQRIQGAAVPAPISGGGIPPEAQTEPTGGLSVPPANPSLGQVPLPTL